MRNSVCCPPGHAQETSVHLSRGNQEQGPQLVSAPDESHSSPIEGQQKKTEGLTTKVEKTKSSSYNPQYGREDISPTTAAPTPMICSAIPIAVKTKYTHRTAACAKGCRCAWLAYRQNTRTHLLYEDFVGEGGGLQLPSPASPAI